MENCGDRLSLEHQIRLRKLGYLALNQGFLDTDDENLSSLTGSTFDNTSPILDLSNPDDNEVSVPDVKADSPSIPITGKAGLSDDLPPRPPKMSHSSCLPPGLLESLQAMGGELSDGIRQRSDTLWSGVLGLRQKFSSSAVRENCFGARFLERLGGGVPFRGVALKVSECCGVDSLARNNHHHYNTPGTCSPPRETIKEEWNTSSSLTHNSIVGIGITSLPSDGDNDKESCTLKTTSDEHKIDTTIIKGIEILKTPEAISINNADDKNMEAVISADNEDPLINEALIIEDLLSNNLNNDTNKPEINQTEKPLLTCPEIDLVAVNDDKIASQIGAEAGIPGEKRDNFVELAGGNKVPCEDDAFSFGASSELAVVPVEPSDPSDVEMPDLEPHNPVDVENDEKNCLDEDNQTEFGSELLYTPNVRPTVEAMDFPDLPEADCEKKSYSMVVCRSVLPSSNVNELELLLMVYDSDKGKFVHFPKAQIGQDLAAVKQRKLKPGKWYRAYPEADLCKTNDWKITRLDKIAGPLDTRMSKNANKACWPEFKLMARLIENVPPAEIKYGYTRYSTKFGNIDVGNWNIVGQKELALDAWCSVHWEWKTTKAYDGRKISTEFLIRPNFVERYSPQVNKGKLKFPLTGFPKRSTVASRLSAFPPPVSNVLVEPPRKIQNTSPVPYWLPDIVPGNGNSNNNNINIIRNATNFGTNLTRPYGTNSSTNNQPQQKENENVTSYQSNQPTLKHKTTRKSKSPPLIEDRKQKMQNKTDSEYTKRKPLRQHNMVVPKKLSLSFPNASLPSGGRKLRMLSQETSYKKPKGGSNNNKEPLLKDDRRRALEPISSNLTNIDSYNDSKKTLYTKANGDGTWTNSNASEDEEC